jgi:hypothetical protein
LAEPTVLALMGLTGSWFSEPGEWGCDVEAIVGGANR